ncbi:MAG: hypothetical protein O3A00_06025, partial [Planctomycetota bacterium]|nr:hypothetical protein [Planctomycetota bacterium]
AAKGRTAADGGGPPVSAADDATGFRRHSACWSGWIAAPRRLIEVRVVKVLAPWSASENIAWKAELPNQLIRIHGTWKAKPAAAMKDITVPFPTPLVEPDRQPLQQSRSPRDYFSDGRVSVGRNKFRAVPAEVGSGIRQNSIG